MVIAVKKDEKIMVGSSICDGCTQMTDKDLVLDENIPFWKPKNTKNCYVFAEDACMETDLLRYNDEIFKGVCDFDSIIANVIPKMQALLRRYYLISEDKSWGSQLLIIINGTMVTIDHYFVVTKFKNFVSLGADYVMCGAIEEMQDASLEERMIFAVKTTEQAFNKRLFPMVIRDMQTKKRKVVFY